MHAVSVQPCQAATAGHIALAQQLHHVVEVFTRQGTVRPRTPAQGIQRLFVLLRCRDGRHNLLGQNVERGFGHLHRIQPALLHGTHEGQALQQLVPREGEQPPAGQPPKIMARPAYPLEKCGHRPRRAYLAHQVDVSHVDAQFQRSGGHNGLQLAALQPLFGGQTEFARQAAVVAGHGVFSQELAELVCHAFGEAARVDEYERAASLLDEFCQAGIDLPPQLVAAHGVEFIGRHLDGEIEFAGMAQVDDAAQGLPVFIDVGRTHEKAGDLFDGPLGCREADARGWPLREGRQSLQREGQVAAAFVACQGVDLIDDHRLHVVQQSCGARRGKQQVERLGRGHQQVGGAAEHGLPFTGQRIACAQGNPPGRQDVAARLGSGTQLCQGQLEIAMDIVAECLERRDVHHLHAVCQRALQAAPQQPIETHQKRRQRLAAAGGSGHQRVPPGMDLRPGPGLRLGGRGKPLGKPLLRQRMKHRAEHAAILPEPPHAVVPVLPAGICVVLPCFPRCRWHFHFSREKRGLPLCVAAAKPRGAEQAPTSAPRCM